MHSDLTSALSRCEEYLNCQTMDKPNINKAATYIHLQHGTIRSQTTVESQFRNQKGTQKLPPCSILPYHPVASTWLGPGKC